MARAFRKSAEYCGFVVKASGIEGHNAIEVGERYHAPLRRVFNARRMDDHWFPPTHALRLSVNTIIDTVGPDRLVPSLSIYGRLSPFPGQEPNPNQEARKSTVTAALTKVSQAGCEDRSSCVLHTQVPPAASIYMKPGEKLRICRGASRQWEGPLTVTHIVRKLAWETDGQKDKSLPDLRGAPRLKKRARRRLLECVEGRSDR